MPESKRLLCHQRRPAETGTRLNVFRAAASRRSDFGISSSDPETFISAVARAEGRPVIWADPASAASSR